MFLFEDLNYVAIVLAILLNVGLGTWWYSPAGFGKLWSKLTGVDMMKSPKKETQQAIMFVFVGAIIQAIVLAVVLRSLEARSVMDGLVAGFILWLGFVGATSIGDALYSRRGLGFWWLNASFFLVIMLASSVILTIM